MDSVKLLVTAACLAALSLAGAEPDVRLGGSLGVRFDLTVSNNFMKLDLARDFFRPFVERKDEEGFVGLGMLTDAAVRLARHSGDRAVVARKDEIVRFVVGNQLPDGYTGCLRERSRLGRLWDIHEMGFVILGLVSEWECFGNESALAAARRNADYIIGNWAKMPDNWELTYITDRETTLGFGYALTRLFAATRDRRYLDFLRNERSLDRWNDPIVVGRDKMIYGQASGYLSTCAEQLALYAERPDARYLRPANRALAFMTRGEGLLIDGNGGIAECWSDDQDGEGSVGETCTATYLLTFYDELIRRGVCDEALVGDLMERLVLNGLFAAQSRDGRRLRYYTPLNGVRKFWENDLYCCANNFRRAISRLPEYVFYAQDGAILANLYTACRAEIPLGKVMVGIVEETGYPRDGKIRMTVNPSAETSFALRLRIPRWCRRPSVVLNGCRVVYKYRPGQILDLPRVWRPGDRVEIDFPMEIRTVRGRKRQSGRFAVLRGPVVYAMDTRAVDAFRGMHPHDVQADMMMDPTRLSESDGAIGAFVSTQDWAVGVEDVSVDGKMPENVRKVRLVPFEDEDNTLTYFRAPNLNETVREDDELFAKEACR